MFVDGFVDAFADCAGLGKEWAFFEFGCHGGIDESWFDGQDGYAGFGEAAAQALQEDGDCSF